MIYNNTKHPPTSRKRRGWRSLTLSGMVLGGMAVTLSSAALAQGPTSHPSNHPFQSVSGLKQGIKELREATVKRAAEKGITLTPNDRPYQKAGSRLEAILYRKLLRASPKESVDETIYWNALKHLEKMPPAKHLMNTKVSKGGASSGEMGFLAGGRTNIITTNARWEFIGPKRLPTPYQIYYGPPGSYTSGRVNGIAYDPINRNVAYLVAPDGGIWKTTDSGRTWASLSTANRLKPNDPNDLSVQWPFPQYATSVAVHPTDPKILYVGTGDFNGFDGPGNGLIVSRDGGATWSRMSTNGLNGQAVSAILVDPDNPNIITITTGRGAGFIWRTIDGGQNWAPIQLPNRTLPQSQADWSALDIGVRDPVSGIRTYYACAIGFGVFRSDDQGATWFQLNPPLAFNNPNDPALGIGLRISASKTVPNVFYIFDASSVSADGRIFKGTRTNNPNENWSWTDISGTFPLTAGGFNNFAQAWYDLHLTAVRAQYRDPAGNLVIGDMIYGGAISLATTTANNPVQNPNTRDLTAGPDWTDISFTLTTNARTHNDQHSFAEDPHNINNGLAGNDGGIYGMSYNPNTNFWSIDGTLSATLGITQIYKADWDALDTTFMIGGSQDNATPQAGGDLERWRNVGGGDGGGCAINIANKNIQYATSQGGTIYYTTNNWASSGVIANSSDWGNTNIVTQISAAPFIGELVTSSAPSAPNAMYYGTQYLWRWTEGSGWLSDASNPPKRKPMGDEQLTDGIITAVGVAAGPMLDSSGNILEIQIGQNPVPYPVTAGNVVYAGGSDGKIWVTLDALNTDADANHEIVWIQINAPTLPEDGPAITSISPNPNNAGDIVVTLGDGRVVRCANVLSSDLRYTNQSGFGVASLPGAFVSDLCRDPEDPENTWFVASDVGIFTTIDGGSNWSNATLVLGLPLVECTAIEAMPRAPHGNGYLYVSTYGRGMWRLTLPPINPPKIEVRAILKRIGNTLQLNGSIINTGGQANNVAITLATLQPDKGAVFGTTSNMPVTIGALPAGGIRPIALDFPGTIGKRGAAVTVRVNLTHNGGTVSSTVRTRLP